MVFDNETLLARYKKRAAEAEGSRAQPRSKKARASSDLAGENPTLPGSNAPGPLQKNKEPASTSRPTEASGSRGHRSQVRRGGSISGGEVRAPTSEKTASPRRASGSAPSSGIPPPPSSSRSHPPSSSKAHPPSSSGADLAGPAEVIIGSGGEPYDPEWTLFYTDSALEDGRVAREIVRGASLPIDRALLEVGPFQEFVDQTYCSAVRHLHEVDMMAKAVSCMRSRAQASDQQLQALKEDLGKVQNKLEEAEEKTKKTESELDYANERIREIESEYVLCQSARRSSEARVADLASELKGKGREIDLLKLKLQQAEDREKEAVEWAKIAVENFRQSAEYQDELAEEAVDGLIRGFEDFREQVAQFCPEIDFGRFQPRLGSDNVQDPLRVEELEVVPGVVVTANPEVVLGVVVTANPEVVPETVTAVESEIAVEATIAEDLVPLQ